jgi:hypothetical protein
VIDTLNISLPSEALLIPSLEGIRTIQSDWGTTMTGNYRNLHIKQRNDNVSISGSLQKFNRSGSLSFDESKQAILNLCETFSFEPSEAKVKRVDFAMNIKTQFEPKIYYPFLGSHQHYFRSPYKHSLNYHNSLRVLSFYDKAEEQNISGNLLRYEQRYLKPETVFKKKLMLVDLLTEEVYRYFLNRWQTDYNKIQKIKTIIPMENFRNPKQFYDYLLALKATEIGSDLLSNQIKIAQRSGHLTKQNAKRIRDKMNRLSKSSFFEPNELINELDNKILSYDR